MMMMMMKNTIMEKDVSELNEHCSNGRSLVRKLQKTAFAVDALVQAERGLTSSDWNSCLLISRKLRSTCHVYAMLALI
ncbi:hypothetical protein AgCh_039655 [Apium graveolens]